MNQSDERVAIGIEELGEQREAVLAGVEPGGGRPIFPQERATAVDDAVRRPTPRANVGRQGLVGEPVVEAMQGVVVAQELRDLGIKRLAELVLGGARDHPQGQQEISRELRPERDVMRSRRSQQPRAIDEN